jgi:hypothetical protein
LALGEELFPVSSIPGSSSPSVALREGFPECFWLFPECLRHSGKQEAPVVTPTSPMKHACRAIAVVVNTMYAHPANATGSEID